MTRRRTPFPVTCMTLVLAALAAASITGCSRTKIVETWRDPSQTGLLDFQRTLVVVLNAPDVYARNIAETAIVERIGVQRAIAGHKYLTEDERTNRLKLSQKLAKGNFDGVVAMGIVGTRTITTKSSAPPDPDENFYAYYDRSAAFLIDEGSPEYKDTVYRVETRIYTVKGERLVWKALSDTVDPQDTRSAIKEIGAAVGAELRKQKLIR